MKHLKSYCSILFLLVTLNLNGQPILGYSDEEAVEQIELEKKYDLQLKAENLDQWMKHLSARPHHVGSPYGKANAEFMEEKFKSWGYETEIETFYVLFPTPKERLLELIGPTSFTASLEEPTLEEDATSGQKDEQLPTYNCFSIDGDVTAELVYVNYGIPADYEVLEQRGIDVKGKIVIAKYYGSWRGIKPKLAAEKGAIGCIIYSDPADDGYAQGDVYPKGAFKAATGVQRGSVLDMPLYPGDPLTPGYGATKKAKRLERSEAPTLTKIPVLPISYADAQPLLAALEGPVAPGNWRGALPITYHIGPGPAKVHLKLSFDWQLRPAYNVIAKMKGSVYPDEWVIRGNHHDAWVNGASDPVSGMVAEMEEARVIGELAKADMGPKRTIVYCAWDAEEPGLLGSTEWVEHHQEELRQKTVAYINTDGNSRGYLGAGGSHTLEKFFGQVAQSVKDPQTNFTVAERSKALTMVRGNPEQIKKAKASEGMQLYALGSGSDYTPFIQHLGIASLNLGFGGEGSGGEYHSIYDSYDHYTRFKDIDFKYGIALAQVAGRTTLRLANAPRLPFEFQRFHSTVNTYLEELKKLLTDTRDKTAHENELIQSGHYLASLDPTKSVKVPEPKDPVPYLNFAPLENALSRLKQSADEFNTRDENKLTATQLAQLNQQLLKAEHLLTREQGLPRRSWFRHHIYAPGFYTGYGVKTLPGVREAIEQRDWKEAQEQIEIVATVLDKFSAHIDQMSGLMGK